MNKNVTITTCIILIITAAVTYSFSKHLLNSVKNTTPVSHPAKHAGQYWIDITSPQNNFTAKAGEQIPVTWELSSFPPQTIIEEDLVKKNTGCGEETDQDYTHTYDSSITSSIAHIPRFACGPGKYSQTTTDVETGNPYYISVSAFTVDNGSQHFLAKDTIEVTVEK